MVTVDTYHIAYVRIDTLTKDRLITPKLPSRCFDQGKQPQFVAGIHEGRVYHIVGTDNLHTCIAQFFGIPPL